MVLGGLVLLFIGGEGLIRGAVSLARNFGLSQLLVSAVVVGFGTSMPEMTVSVSAALKGSSDIAVGNVVGSNIANILLIVGLVATLCPIYIAGNAIKHDAFVMIGASFILCGLALVGNIIFIAGFLMFSALIAYIGWSYVQDKKAPVQTDQYNEKDAGNEPQFGSLMASIYTLMGLILLISGSYLLIEGAVAIARDFGLSEAIIGLTIVAVGTSLPELATATVAAYHKHSELVIGNILGSCIFNILAILSVTAMISPISIADHIAHYDIWIMLSTVIFLSFYLLRGMTIGRVSGIFMLVAYCVYTAWLYIGTGV